MVGIIDTLGNDRHIVETLTKIKQHDEALQLIDRGAGDVEAFTMDDLDMMRDAVNSQRKYFVEDLRYALIRRKELLQMMANQSSQLN